MGVEIERKFLVDDLDMLSTLNGELFRQGYLPSKSLTTMRVRIAGTKAFLTVKGENAGIERLEFEYAIPVEEAQQMLDQLCEKPIIEKYRYCLPIGDIVWEIDSFLGDNQGLVVAEIELSSADQCFDKPAWLGQEVSGDPKYYNSNLAKKPFKSW